MPGGGGGRKAAASAAVEEEAAESAEAAAVGCGDTFIGDASTLAQADEESPSDGDPGHALEVTGPDESAAAIRDVLAGQPGPRREVVVLNAAAALWAAGSAPSLPEARMHAERAIDDGSAAGKLAALVARSNRPHGT